METDFYTLYMFIKELFVSTLPIRNGNEIIVTVCGVKFTVSTLPIRNGNKFKKSVACSTSLRKYLTYKEWKHILTIRWIIC